MITIVQYPYGRTTEKSVRPFFSRKKNVFLHIVYKHQVMNKNFIKDPFFPECPIRNVLARIGGKWTLAVLYTLASNGTPMRFKDIERANPDCSQKMLTQTLRGLEADGLVSRTVYPEMPPRVEYALTERGQSFMPVMRQLLDWAFNNLHDIVADREKFLDNELGG